MNRKQQIEEALDEVMPVAEKLDMTRDQMREVFRSMTRVGCYDFDSMKRSIKYIVNNIQHETT